jgi:hypothetical protein
VWVSNLLRQRQERGVWNSVIPDLVQGTGRRIAGTFSNFFRIDERCFEDILSKVGPAITRQDTHLRPAIPAAQRLAVTLRYLATGCTFTELYYNFRISISSLSCIIPETCEAIFTCLKEEYLNTPNTVVQWRSIIEKLNDRWQFPNCIGSLESKHAVMVKPWHAGSYYHNYKGSESIVLLALCDADYR